MRDAKAFLLRQWGAAEPFGKRLAFQKLHANEVKLAMRPMRRVNLKDVTDVRMADISRVAHLGRKPLAETCLRALQRYAQVHLFIFRFPNNAHAPACHLADDAETIE